MIELERDALEQLAQRLDDSFDRACQMLMACSGRIVVSGMGKSGHIGRKIAATLASTGSPAFFVHPGEASHGDLGMILSGDVIVIISHSGETPEILTILPLIKRIGAKLIVLTGSSHSAIGQAADPQRTWLWGNRFWRQSSRRHTRPARPDIRPRHHAQPKQNAVGQLRHSATQSSRRNEQQGTGYDGCCG